MARHVMVVEVGFGLPGDLLIGGVLVFGGHIKNIDVRMNTDMFDERVGFVG